MNSTISTEDLHELMESNHEILDELKHRANAVRLAREVVEGVKKQMEKNGR